MSDNVGNIAGSIGSALVSGLSNVGRFIPEPRNKLGSVFGRVLNGVGSMVSTAFEGFAGVSPTNQNILQQQIEVQREMQLVSLYSNIEKSKHETSMVGVRNLKVG